MAWSFSGLALRVGLPGSASRRWCCGYSPYRFRILPEPRQRRTVAMCDPQFGFGTMGFWFAIQWALVGDGSLRQQPSAAAWVVSLAGDRPEAPSGFRATRKQDGRQAALQIP